MNELWNAALERLSNKIAPQNFDMWLRPIECHSCEGLTLRLEAPNPYVKLWFESNYLETVLLEIKAQTGTQYQIELEVKEQVETLAGAKCDDSDDDIPTQERIRPNFSTNGSTEGGTQSKSEPPLMSRPQNPSTNVPKNIPRAQTAPFQNSGSTVSSYVSDNSSARHSVNRAPDNNSKRADTPIKPPMTDNIINVALNPRYNFESFISGPSNQLAFAAAQSCANSYPPKYNPVFICGGVGLGKTHLLHAIGHQIMRNRPNSKLCYITGERFMNEYVHAIRTNQMHAFRHRYRENCDVLLVDDVQFLAGKDGTQDEFFHTFNALHDSHRQIVLTADRKPHEISDIADRLRSRFAWGLLADIEPPELEVRMAILTEKAEAENIVLPDSVSMYIASSIKSNVRELEGALIRLAAYASLSRKEITLEFARETLEGSITRPPEHMTVDTILKCVAGYYGLKVSDLKSARRHKSIAGPRAIAMYLARTHTKESYPDLGRSFGGKHHTTVISAVEKITRKLVDDNALRGEVNAIENNLLR